jgi:hypothetical protein
MQEKPINGKGKREKGKREKLSSENGLGVEGPLFHFPFSIFRQYSCPPVFICGEVSNSVDPAGKLA